MQRSKDTVKQKWHKPWMCVCWKCTFLHRSLLVKSQQNRTELVTILSWDSGSWKPHSRCLDNLPSIGGRLDVLREEQKRQIHRSGHVQEDWQVGTRVWRPGKTSQTNLTHVKQGPEPPRIDQQNEEEKQHSSFQLTSTEQLDVGKAILTKVQRSCYSLSLPTIKCPKQARKYLTLAFSKNSRQT